LIKYQENRVEYGAGSETYEKFTFLGRTGAYKGVQNPFGLLVDRFERVISNSNMKWVDSALTKDSENSKEESS
jgi:hypothetical protein